MSLPRFGVCSLAVGSALQPQETGYHGVRALSSELFSAAPRRASDSRCPGRGKRGDRQVFNFPVRTLANRLRTIYEKPHVANRTQAALSWRPTPVLTRTLDEPPG